MTEQEAITKSVKNQGLVNNRYRIDSGTNVTVKYVYVQDMIDGTFEVFCRLLPDGLPENDSLHIVDNIDNLSGYKRI